jgi:trigger factor
MKVNETREFEIDVEDSEDYDEEMRGKTVRFKATLKEVFSYELPVLDDEFAKSFSDFDTLDELREDLSRKLFDTVKQQKRDEHIDELFEKLQGIVKVNYPPIMLEDEIDSSVERFKQQVAQAFQGLQFEDYLRIANKTESDLREEFEESAKKNLFRGLVLSQLVEEEALEVSDEEIDDELQTALLSFGGNAAIARQFLNSPENRRNIKNQLLTEKALDRLSEIAQGQAPALDEIQALKEQARAESEEQAKPGKKRSPKKKASVSDSKQRAEKFKDESVLTLEPTAETTSEESDE